MRVSNIYNYINNKKTEMKIIFSTLIFILILKYTVSYNNEKYIECMNQYYNDEKITAEKLLEGYHKCSRHLYCLRRDL